MILQAATTYVRAGYRVVPIPHRQKGPVLPAWNELRLGEAELPQHFGGNVNIGLILGEASGWLVDVDLDCEEARALADQFLPATPAVTGRPSSPRSHRWYIAKGAQSKRHQFPDRRVIVELRSSGLQTVVGPSVHPSGETVDILTGEPATVDAAMLSAAVDALAAAVQPLRFPDDLIRRASAYLDQMPPAISGQGGHAQTYAAATALAHGFALHPAAALHLLSTRYNLRCQPPWSLKELEHKVSDAASKPHDRAKGWLRDTVPPAPDISAIAPAPKKKRAKAFPDPGPFPASLLDVPGLIGKVVAYNLETAHRKQPVLALAGAICLQATLAGRKVRDARGNRTNVYCVGVAPASSGKDHPRSVNKTILFQAGLGKLEGPEEVASDSGLVAAVQADPSLLFQFDEFGRWLLTAKDPKRNPHLYAAVSTLMKLYSSANIAFKGKAYSDRKKNLTVDQPCVSVYGTTTAEHFYESLSVENLSDGFLARLLIFRVGEDEVPDRVRATEQAPPADVLATARWWGEYRPGGNLTSEHPEPRLVPCTDKANAIFDEFDRCATAELRKPDAKLASLWGRAEQKACRLALIHAASEHPTDPVIDADAACWACSLVTHLTQKTLSDANKWVAEGIFDSRQKRVIRIIEGMGGVASRNEITQRTRSMTMRERAEVLDNLVATGELEEETVTHDGAGRPSAGYRIP